MECLKGSLLIYVVKGIILVLVSVTVSISIYGIHRLYLCRNKDYIKKRSKWVVHEILGSNLAVTLALLTTTIVIPSLCDSQHTDIVIHTESLVSWFLIVLSFNVKHFQFLLRGKLHHFTIQAEWQKVINRDEAQKRLDRNWFIQYQHRFDTLPSTYAYFGAVHFLMFCGCELSHIYADAVREAHFVQFIAFKAVESMVLVLSFLMMLLIAAKIPLLDDRYFVHWERRTITMLMGILLILWLSGHWIYSINGELLVTGELSAIEQLLFASLRVLVLFSIVMTATLGTIYKNNSDAQQLMKFGGSVGIGGKSVSSFQPSPNSQCAITLDQVCLCCPWPRQFTLVQLIDCHPTFY